MVAPELQGESRVGTAGERGYMLAEVLVAMAVGAVMLTGATALLVASAGAVTQAELETSATWIASRTIEQWRSSATMPDEGQAVCDRVGQVVAGAGVFDVRWRARPDGRLWHVAAEVSSARLRRPVRAEAVVARPVS